MKRILSILWLGLGIFLVCSFSVARGNICTEPVKTKQGLIQGQASEKYPACEWLGIPYAQPPVGEFRLSAPQPPKPHQGIYLAHKYGASCIQRENITSGGKSESISEDCLYLNIWRPAKPGKFPVMFWIHGGSFMNGSGSYELYRGARLSAEKDVVVVTINYRLGALGFLALPELAEQDPNHSTGNYGLLDQIQALKWVKENIAGFGGDPENITIFGQSAGGMSVVALLVSPLTKNLFHRAIIMSAPSHLFQTMEQCYEKSKKQLEKIGCEENEEVVECLRSKPETAFALKSPNDLFSMGLLYSPCVDHYALPDLPLNLIAQGNYHKVPTMLGTTKDELRIYTMSVPGLGLWSKPSVNFLLKLLTGPNYQSTRSMYYYSDYRRPIDLAFAFGNDMVFNAPTFKMAENMAGNNPVYLYQFDWNDTHYPHKLGAFHALDVPFVFGGMNLKYSLAKLLASKKTYQEAEPLALKMMSYFTNFARAGNPNGEGLPPWSEYQRSSRARLHFDFPIQQIPLTEKEIARYRYFNQHPLEEIITLGKQK